MLPAGLRNLAETRHSWAILLLALALGTVLQNASRCYDADFSGHPDEPSHFVTAIMLSQYLADPLQSPLPFAERYYLQYPRVAIGHWPPLGYAIQGAWAMVFGSSRSAALVLMLLYAAVSACLIYELIWPGCGRLLGAGAAIAWLANTHVQAGYQQVMLDVPGVAFCLAALLAWRRYMERPGWQRSLMFGAAAGCALLVKQTAIVLALVPVLAVLVGRRWDLARRTDFYAGAFLTVLVAGPWYAYQIPLFYRSFSAWSGALRGGIAANASIPVLLSMSPLPVVVLALAGLLIGLLRPRMAHVVWVPVMLSSAVWGTVFQVINEPRYLLVALAAQVALAVLAIGQLPLGLRPFAAIALVALNLGWSPTPHHGYNQAAAIIAAGPPGHILLSGRGDGAVIAAAASLNPEPGKRYWLRASKVLAEVGWAGELRRMYVQAPEAVSDILDHAGVNQVWLDRSGKETPYEALLREALDRNAESWQNVPIAASNMELFRRRNTLPAQPVSFFMRRLNRNIADKGAVK
jgi:hypothetical protein